MILKFMFLGGVLPGALAAAFLYFVWRRGAGGGEKMPLWAAPLAFALAVLPAELVVREGLPSLWPRGAADRMPHVAGILLCAAMIETLWARRLLGRMIVCFSGVAGALSALLWPRVPAFWSALEAGAWIGGLALLACTLASIVDRVAASRRGPDIPFVLTLCLTAQSIVLLKSGNAYLAQIAGGAAAGVGGAVAAGMLVPSLSISRGGVSVAVGMMVGLAAAGHFYAPDGIPMVQTLLVVCASGISLLGELPAIARLKVWMRLSILTAGCVVPLGIAVASALRNGDGAALHGY